MEYKSVLLMKIREEYARQITVPDGDLFHFGAQGMGKVIPEESRIIPMDKSRSLSGPQFEALDSIPELLDDIRALEPLIRRWIDIQQPMGETAISLMFRVQEYSLILQSLSVGKIIFGTGIPHHLDAMCWSIAAQSLGLKQIFLYPTIFEGILLPISQLNFYNRRIDTSLEISALEGDKAVNRFIDAELDPDLAFVSTFQPMAYSGLFSIFRLATSKVVRKMINWIRIRKLSHEGFRAHKISTLISSMIVHRHYQIAYERASKKNLPSNLCSKIVFFGHVDPEATTFPGGLPWASQIEFLVALRRMFPQNEIYFLEHPDSWRYFNGIGDESRFGLFRTENFLEQLKRLEVTPLDSSSTLSRSGGCYVAATLVGTIAIQEALRGRKSIVGGSAWYDGLPGTLAFRQWNEDLRDNIETCNCKSDKRISKDAFDFLANLIGKFGIPNAQGIGAVTSVSNIKGFVSSLERMARDNES